MNITKKIYSLAFIMLRQIISIEIYTLIITFCLVILAIAKHNNTSRFYSFLLILGNTKYFKVFYRQQKYFDNFNILLYINLILSTSLFIYLGLQFFFTNLNFDYYLILKISASLLFYIISKKLFELFIAVTLNLKDLIYQFSFKKSSYTNFVGILLVVSNIFICYLKINSAYIFYTTFACIALINSIGFINSFKKQQKIISSNLFYFILYICALEITPYVILFKLISG